MRVIPFIFTVRVAITVRVRSAVAVRGGRGRSETVRVRASDFDRVTSWGRVSVSNNDFVFVNVSGGGFVAVRRGE